MQQFIYRKVHSQKKSCIITNKCIILNHKSFPTVTFHITTELIVSAFIETIEANHHSGSLSSRLRMKSNSSEVRG